MYVIVLITHLFSWQAIQDPFYYIDKRLWQIANESINAETRYSYESEFDGLMKIYGGYNRDESDSCVEECFLLLESKAEIVTDEEFTKLVEKKLSLRKRRAIELELSKKSVKTLVTEEVEQEPSLKRVLSNRRLNGNGVGSSRRDSSFLNYTTLRYAGL